nr:immunoglobulin heavy chain junction region [Macaca mulatta]MOW23217.1 immunoglobulin heavy chain junction region [Macaca mulatta]MOW23595.1 immunoglobulin heavy chain junction region [Macaca mulatta]MOW23650.1 immunoglobulin heavy chain junction region [Macaca mulatta]MOW25148.1 immunoglobulin heavy chain junction region [Macaca mulatta]
CASRLVVRDYW